MPVTFTNASGDALRTAKTQAGTNPLDGLTLAQIDAWIVANVTDLASAKTALRQMAKLVAIHERRLDRIEAALKAYRQAHE